VLTLLLAQTDGWLSDASARVYEVSTETLFLGRQDAMQRQTLVRSFPLLQPCNVILPLMKLSSQEALHSCWQERHLFLCDLLLGDAAR
jgi:hypothetical protein